MNKPAILLLAALSAASLHAADRGGISNVAAWFNGNLQYNPEARADGSVLFTACDEGQDLAFLFTPREGRADEYAVTDGSDDACVNPFADSTRARHIRQDGQNLICLYDDQGHLNDVLSPATTEIGSDEAAEKWKRQLMGGYTSAYGEPMVMRMTGSLQFNGNELPYRLIDFNGTVTGLIEITGGTRLEGLWKVKITRDGLKMTKVEAQDEYGLSLMPTGDEEVFTWSYRDIPRFDYASRLLLNDGQFRRLDKSLLRLIRNEIWFHHGYVPKSDDLREYLVGKQWYSPRESNDGIADELSLVEKLNIEMLKTAEIQKEIADRAFDFEKYRKAMVEQAENNLNYMKSSDDIRLVNYALIDVDGDGQQEVWVRGDEGQDFQGVCAITPEGGVSLIMNSDARSELTFYPEAVAAEGYYGDGESRGFICTVKDSRPDRYGFKRVLFDNSSEDMDVLEEDYNIDGRKVTKAQYDAFVESLGKPYWFDVEWHSVPPTAP